MKNQRPGRHFPVSLRELASYLGISPALLSMTQTGRHGPRQLNSSSSTKMMELVLAHNRSRKDITPGHSLRVLQDHRANDCDKFAQKLLLDAGYATARAAVLKTRLQEMAEREQEYRYWLNTVDQLLAALPKNRETNKDRRWLENQQLVVAERIRKSRLSQPKLEIQIETAKLKASVYRDIHKKLLKKV